MSQESTVGPGNGLQNPPDPALAAQMELASRVLARRRLLKFVMRFNPRYLPGWVHEDICYQLEKFSRQVAAGESPRLGLFMPPRHGKALAVGTLVPTPDGFVPVEALRPGDFVFGSDGKPTEVVAVSPVWRDRQLYEVSADDGASVTVDAEHDWTVRLCRKRPVFKTKSTAWLAARSSARRPALQTYAAAQFPDAELPVPPYILGVWLGDGCSGHATITQGDNDIALIRAEIEREGVITSDRATDNTFGLLGVQAALRKMGLLHNKHVPDAYKFASAPQRLALLQGLIDTDGHVAPDGQVEFCSISEQLATDVLTLVRSLGVKASLILGDATLNGEFISRKYRVMFYMEGAARLPRKAMRCRSNTRTPNRFLSFRKAGKGDTVCIQVAADDQQYLVGQGFLLTHNSELVSRNFPAWHLGQYPWHEYISCSYNLDLARTFSRKVKMIIEDPMYAKLFPALHPDKNNWSSEEWTLLEGGGYVAAGVGGGITGRGAHVLSIDDPVKSAEEADSPGVLEKIWDWYGATAYTRLAPGGGVLLIQTCWSDLDLAGRIQTAMHEDPEYDNFTIIKYPAVAEEYEYRSAVTSEIIRSPQELPVRDIIEQSLELLRAPGDPLHAERYDAKKLASIKKTLPTRFWNALYQQNPVPDDGAYFKKDWFRHNPLPAKENCNVFLAWDFAISEQSHNDYTVGTASLQDYDDMLHFAEMSRFRSGDAYAITEAMMQMVKRWYTPSLVLGVEDGQIWRAIEAVLRRRMKEMKLYPTIEVLRPVKDKMVRARPLQGRMQQGQVSFPHIEEAPWVETMQRELLRFPNGTNDDIVDSCAWNAWVAANVAPPTPPSAKPMKSWRDRINGRARSGGSHMSA